MKIKVADATPTQIDWLVAKLEGWEYKTGLSNWYGNKPWLERRDKDGVSRVQLWELAYTSNPVQAYPIIHREGIGTYRECISEVTYQERPGERSPYIWTAREGTEWEAIIGLYHVGEHEGKEQGLRVRGATALIAAMKAYVIFKLGEEVDVPEELT